MTTAPFAAWKNAFTPKLWMSRSRRTYTRPRVPSPGAGVVVIPKPCSAAANAASSSGITAYEVVVVVVVLVVAIGSSELVAVQEYLDIELLDVEQLQMATTGPVPIEASNW